LQAPCGAAEVCGSAAVIGGHDWPPGEMGADGLDEVEAFTGAEGADSALTGGAHNGWRDGWFGVLGESANGVAHCLADELGPICVFPLCDPIEGLNDFGGEDDQHGLLSGWWRFPWCGWHGIHNIYRVYIGNKKIALPQKKGYERGRCRFSARYFY
jgi:hypothetical protein